MDLEHYSQQTIEMATIYGVRVLAALFILLVGKWLASTLGRVSERALIKRSLDPTVSQFAGKIVFALTLIFTIIAALSQVGIQTASLIAVVGAAGLAVGLALQGALSNFAAGVLLVMFRPCRVGDYVEAGGASGTIQNISLFSTVLNTPDNKQITIPNSNIMSGAIVNYSALPQRRVDLTVGIGYDSDIGLAKRELEQLLAADTRVLADPPPTIAVQALADSSVNLIVRPWVEAADYWPVYFELTERIKTRFDEVGITIPFPQMHLHMHGGAAAH